VLSSSLRPNSPQAAWFPNTRQAPIADWLGNVPAGGKTPSTPVEVEPFKSSPARGSGARKAKTGNPWNTVAPWLLCAALHSQTISEIATMSNLDHPSYRPAVETGAMAEDAHAILVNKVSWGAIFSGVVVALVVQVLLTSWEQALASLHWIRAHPTTPTCRPSR
jgi:hypothetical protein